MDPNATLAELRKLALDLEVTTFCDLAGIEPVAKRITELVQALDEWLSAGGILPSAWVPEMGREAKESDPERPSPLPGPSIHGWPSPV